MQILEVSEKGHAFIFFHKGTHQQEVKQVTNARRGFLGNSRSHADMIQEFGRRRAEEQGSSKEVYDSDELLD
jgi:hypothetical protein